MRGVARDDVQKDEASVHIAVRVIFKRIGTLLPRLSGIPDHVMPRTTPKLHRIRHERHDDDAVLGGESFAGDLPGGRATDDQCIGCSIGDAFDKAVLVERDRTKDQERIGTLTWESSEGLRTRFRTRFIGVVPSPDADARRDHM